MQKLRHVLVIEDDEAIEAVLEDALVDAGYRFVRSATGGDMRRCLRSGGIDICVIDVRLPNGDDGLALADEAASHGCGVIVISGDQEYYEEIRAAGYHFLAKPFRLAALVRLVDDVLEETVTADAKQRASGH